MIQPPQELDLDLFIQQHGRMPHLGDPVAPWKYPGWLLRYVVAANLSHPDVPDRWGYLFRTLEAGRLLDEPIPRIKFGVPDRKVFSMLDQCVRIPAWDMGGWSDFRKMVEWIAYGLQVREEYPDIEEAKQEKLYREFNADPMLLSPYDYLGQWISERKGNGWNPGAFFPTPHPVIDCMVGMMDFDVCNEEGNVAKGGRDPRVLSVCDPCLGTGRMLMHASNYSMNLFGQDIDPLLCLVSMVNGALYAPWMVCPLPEAILATGEPVQTPKRRRREKVALVTQLDDVLAPVAQRSDLGTDSFARVALDLLRQAGFDPAAMEGTANWNGRSVPGHLWLEVGPFVVDYRLRRSLGPDAPHGVFRVCDRQGLSYDGVRVALEVGAVMTRVILG